MAQNDIEQHTPAARDARRGGVLRRGGAARLLAVAAPDRMAGSPGILPET